MPKTILLADHSATIRKMIELTFSETDIRVESVGSGSAALERITTLEPDLILADVVMPEPSGYEICKQVKASSRPVPVVLLAGSSEPFDHERARACGADFHLVKPFETGFLLQKVRSLLSPPPPAPEAAPSDASQELEEVFADLAKATVSPSPGVDSSWSVDAGDLIAEATGAAPTEDMSAEPEVEAGADTATPPAEPERVGDELAKAPPEVRISADDLARATVSPSPGEDSSWSLDAGDLIAEATGAAPTENMSAEPEAEAGADTATPPAEPERVGDELTKASPEVRISADEIAAIARAVVEQLSTDVLQKILWEVVPQLAEIIIRERIRQLEKEIED